MIVEFREQPSRGAPCRRLLSPSSSAHCQSLAPWILRTQGCGTGTAGLPRQRGLDRSSLRAPLPSAHLGLKWHWTAEATPGCSPKCPAVHSWPVDNWGLLTFMWEGSTGFQVASFCVAPSRRIRSACQPAATALRPSVSSPSMRPLYQIW